MSMAVNRTWTFDERNQRDILMMSSAAKLTLAKLSLGSSPVGCAHVRPIQLAETRKQDLQIKGFLGGVPSNTKTAAVKPRVGIAR